MRRGRVFLYLALILILVAVAAVVVLRFLPGTTGTGGNKPPTPTPAPKVLVLTQNLKQGDLISVDVIQAMPWSGGDSTQVYKESEKAELIGRQLKYDLDAGTPIFKNFLLSEGEQLKMTGSTWALNVPPGMVAVSIPIGRLSGISYAPRPGDHVDVIVTVLFIDLDTSFQTMLPNQTGTVIASGPPDPETGIRNPLTVDIFPNIYGRTEIDPVLGQAVYLIPIEAQRPRMTSQMLLQDAVVLRMGEFPVTGTDKKAPTPTAAAGARQQQTNQQQAAAQAAEVPVVITLIVSPQDAVTLNYLIFSEAQMTLALRNPTDNSRLQISPVTLQFLLDQYQIPVPVRLPYGMYPRTDLLVLPTPIYDKVKK